MTPTDPAFASTRTALHQVAEHVLAAGQYAAAGTIRLRYAPGGFGTAVALPGDRYLAVVEGRLAVQVGDALEQYPLTTLAELAERADVPLGLPASVYPAATPLTPDAPLAVDANAARELGDWYGLADAALRRFAPSSEPVIWPEHFDIGITLDAVNYGASPGDGEFPEPYLYVGPHGGPPASDDFWNASFGAALGIADVRSVAEGEAFFRDARRRLVSAGNAPA